MEGETALFRKGENPPNSKREGTERREKNRGKEEVRGGQGYDAGSL